MMAQNVGSTKHRFMRSRGPPDPRSIPEGVQEPICIRPSYLGEQRRARAREEQEEWSSLRTVVSERVYSTLRHSSVKLSVPPGGMPQAGKPAAP